MDNIWKYIVLAVIGYVCGNFNFARIFTKIKKEDNINSKGSGNPGSMNMLRTHGAILGFTTLFFDALKAAIPALIGFLWFGADYSTNCLIAIYAGGVPAVIGHIYPVLYKFKGGKGIASTVGLFSVVNPLASLIIFVVSFIFFYFVKIGSLASFLFIYSFAIYQTCLPAVNQCWIILVLMWGIVALDTFAHRENIKRLITNTERITSFREGVKKDIERIKEKKAEKLEKYQNREEKIGEEYQKKIELKEEALQKKIEIKTEKLTLKCEKKLNKHSKKVRKTSKKFDNKTEKVEKRGEFVASIWEGLANKIEERDAEKEQKLKEKQDGYINEDQVKHEEVLNKNLKDNQEVLLEENKEIKQENDENKDK